MVRNKGKCQYPWCKEPDFLDDDRDKACYAFVRNEAGTGIFGPMHVRHILLFTHRFDGGREEIYEDDIESPPVRLHTVTYGGKMLEEIVNTRPTQTAYKSEVDKLIDRMDAGEVLIIQKAGGSARRTRVHVWRKTL